MSCSKYLVAIVGPTAIGKTALAIQLAKQFKTEILSADSRQFYKGMAIGTAQPTWEDRQGIPHHFLDFLSVQETYTASKFEMEALQKLRDLFVDKDLVILVGGSGLYVKALCEGLTVFPPISPTIRLMLNTLLKERGLVYLVQLLKEKDPDFYNKVDLKNPRRVIRALEVCLGTGQAYSDLLVSLPKQGRPFTTIKIGLMQEKTLLDQRIAWRVDHMMAQGLLQEVETLYPYRDYNALQTLGYRELLHYLDGKYTLQEAINWIKINTKQYAKRQMTWFKKDAHIVWFAPNDCNQICHYIQSIVEPAALI